MNICQYCSKEISKMHIKKHEKSCKLNPLNLKYCLNCGCVLKSLDSKKFCNRSCSTSFNNKKRILSTETKNKIRNTIKKNSTEPWNKGKRKYNIKCEICGKIFHRNGKYCSLKCMGISRKSETWSKLQRELYKSGKQHVGGGTTIWYDYKNIRVQGTYELRTCKILDFWKENDKIKSWEYTKDRYSYIGFDGKEHSYLLDFKITNKDNTFFYIETKGYKTDDDDLKWNAIKKLGYKLIVWYNDNICFEEKKMPH